MANKTVGKTFILLYSTLAFEPPCKLTALALWFGIQPTVRRRKSRTRLIGFFGRSTRLTAGSFQRCGTY